LLTFVIFTSFQEP